LSVQLDGVGALPLPPPLIRTLAVSNPEEDSCVAELKYGIPPEVTVPATVSGKEFDPAIEVRTPPDIVIVVLSGLTQPS
jgi:hypothetical protein